MNPEVQMIFDFMLLTPGQRAAFAIRCAMAVHKEEPFARWAGGWLSGSDRSRKAAALRAAWDAAWDGGAAAWAAEAAQAAREAAQADWTAEAAARAADWAIKVNPDLNLTAIAEIALATHKEEE